MADPVASGSQALGKSMKSVPPVVWVGAIFGGLGVAYYLRKKSASSTTTNAAQTPTVLTYTGTGGGDTTGTDATSTTGAPTTNQAWATAAQNYLLAAFPQYNAIDVSNAINAYINAAQLTPQQQAMVSQAISGIGPAPQSLPPVTGSGSSTPTPSTSNAVVQPAVQKQVTLPQDMWIQDIVANYMPVAGWGEANESGHDVYPQGNLMHIPGYDYDIWSGAIASFEIQEANPQLNWAYKIPAGTVVNIPFQQGQPASAYQPPPTANAGGNS